MSDSGIFLGSFLVIEPWYGRRKEIILQRTKYDFLSQGKTSEEAFPIEMQALGEDEFEVRCQYHDNLGYILKTLSGNPFKHNGRWVFNIVLRVGDEVLLGGNILKFFREKPKETEKESIPKEIIESSMPILLQGETGTGKTTLAQKIHEQSGVAGKFVHLCLSSFAPSLIESEIFGHVKGAFTGAILDKMGALRMAHQGTLFLDEIDSLPLEIQVKLLLFLDNQTYRQVGSTQEKSVNTRIIFASGQNLEELVEKNLMRKDFYYRLNAGYFYKLPSLRENPELIKKNCEDFSFKNQIIFSDRVIEKYSKYSWPGNYRQLMSHLMKKTQIKKNKIICTY